MTKGVPPSGSGSRPSDRAASVSAVPASIPNAVDALTRLVVALEWELPAIGDGIEVERRLGILARAAREGRAAVIANGGKL